MAGRAPALAAVLLSGVAAAGPPVPPVHEGRPAETRLAGEISLGALLDGRLDVLRDDFRLFGADDERFPLPAVRAHYASDGEVVVPLERLPIPAAGGYDLLLLPGRSWHDRAAGTDRALLPFALLEKNANCLHYGTLWFDYDASGARGPGRYRIASDTCQYLKFDASGRHRVSFDFRDSPQAGEALADYSAERAARLPRRPIAALADEYPGADAAAFGDPDEVDPRHMTAYGFLIDGVHYAGGCATRAGPYPACAELPLPSYSLAKSLVAGLALMRAEALYPGSRRRPVSELVPACASEDGWDRITLEDLLDMATGRYDSTGYETDEDALLASPFFLAADHATKLRFACERWPRREPAGERWVYHTTDSYILGTALTALVREQAGAGADFFETLVVEPIFAPLGLGPLSRFTRRTQDAARQPFTGWGLVLTADDLARLAQFLGPRNARLGDASPLDAGMLDAALRRDGGAALPTGVPGLSYDNGFWAYDVGPHLGCLEALPVPLMSGFGGIILTLFPNGSSYYYVSDGGTHRWLAAARAAHAIRPMCAGAPTGESQ